VVNSSEVKSFALGVGFSAVGVIGRDRISHIPVGPISDLHVHRSSKEILSSVRSIVILGYHVWDPIYNVVATKADDSGAPFHQLYAVVAMSKSWEVAHYLEALGYEAVATTGICLKKAAVLAGIGAQGKHTVVISPDFGPSLRFAAVLTSAELEDDAPFTWDICGSCTKCVDACPTKALKPHEIDISRCMVYAVENPSSERVSASVRELEKQLIRRPTAHSFIECTICLDACPFGRTAGKG